MDDRVKTARRKFDEAAVTSENSVRDMQLGYAAVMENARDLNIKLVEMVRASAETALDATTQIASAKTPADLAQVWSAHATKQFAMLTDQGRELTAAWQKLFIPRM